MSPEAVAVRSFVGRVARRLGMFAAMEGAAVGLAVAAVLALAGWPARTSVLSPAIAGLVAVIVGAAARVLSVRPGARRAVAATEQATSESRNLLLTAMELATPPVAPHGSVMATNEYVASVVLRRAGALAGRLDPAALFPVRSRILAIVGVGSLWVAALARATDGTFVGPAASATATVDRVDVVVRPPAYTGLPLRAMRDPERIDLLEGSMVSLSIRSNASAIIVGTVDSLATRTIPRPADGIFAAQVSDTSRFISLEPRAADGAAGPGRLIGMTVTRDGAPRARITAPARDMVMPDGNRALDVAIEARDDIGLSTLTLTYTKVSGSGEQYTFVDGEVPLTVARDRATAWQAHTRWDLRTLHLEPGDIVVYRAVVNDARPGRVPFESDAFIAEVASPGMVAADGFAVSPDDDRYALSQQMIVLKTERLLAGRAALPDATWADSAAAIAAEQRRVRAEFVFMMGGEVNDAGSDTSMTMLNEEAEAAGESDILAGREANRGRIALRGATRAMSLAARELDRGAADSALTFARQAVKALEEAFSRNRILLRALAQREDLDPARRLSGTLTDLARAPRTVLPAAGDERAAVLRDVLRGIGAAVRGGGARSASLLAERLLRLDVASKPMQGAASSLSAAAGAFTRGDSAAARRGLESAALVVAAELRRSLPDGPAQAPAFERGAARGMLTDLLRGGRP